GLRICLLTWWDGTHQCAVLACVSDCRPPTRFQVYAAVSGEGQARRQPVSQAVSPSPGRTLQVTTLRRHKAVPASQVDPRCRPGPRLAVPPPARPAERFRETMDALESALR